jgi:hypothetical protein
MGPHYVTTATRLSYFQSALGQVPLQYLKYYVSVTFRDTRTLNVTPIPHKIP